MKESIQSFLQPTILINSQHPEIIDKANELITNIALPEEKAQRIFYFIRDDIRYEFRAKFEEEQYRASYVLQERKGFCTQKAILFCALARCCGIPAGLYFYDIIDHSLPEHLIAFMRTQILYHHGIVALFLNNAWHRYDATLDIDLVSKQQLIPVEFHPDRDCLMHAKTRTGKPHINYCTDYGLFADVSFTEILSWFKQAYPHLVEKYENYQINEKREQ